MNGNGLVFLVVDNNEWIVRLTNYFITQKFGDNVCIESVSNGEEAIAKFQDIVARDQHKRLHSVLIGCHLPVRSGIDAVIAMRSIEAANRDNKVAKPVCIIGSSAAMCEELGEQFHAAGANYALSKPIDRQVLFGVFDEITAMLP